MERPERLERGGPSWLLKLRRMGTHGVHMKGVLGWFNGLVVPRAFCLALVAIVSQVQAIFFSSYTISFHFICPHRPLRWTGSPAALPVS